MTQPLDDVTHWARLVGRPAQSDPQIGVTVKDGTVLVASDAHYWPDIVTTAHRTFVKFCRDLKPAAVIMNGDVIDGSGISRHAPIGWEGRPDLADEIDASKARLAEIIDASPGVPHIWPLGNHDCLDTESECLTRRGWVRHDDLRGDDQVFSLVDGRGVWSAIDEIVRFPFSGELVRVEKTRFSMAVTDNHRVLGYQLNWRTGRFDRLGYHPAGSMPYSLDVPMCAHVENVECELSDDQIRLAGWILTDGHFGPYNISLYQSKQAGVDQIAALLIRLGIEHSRSVRQRRAVAICGREPVSDPLPAHHFLVSARSSRLICAWLPSKRLPEWVWRLSSRQFQVFIEAIIAGDGTWDGARDGRCAVIYGHRWFLDGLQAIAVQHGWRGRVATDSRGDARLWINRAPNMRIERPSAFREAYNGIVWCLRVPYGNFMVRRSGSAYFTGNSRFESRLAQVAPEYARVHGVHLKDHFPEWSACWSCVINGSVVVKHRYKGGLHATHNNTVSAGVSMVTGHLHSLKVTPYTDYTGTRYGVDTGTLAEPRGPQFRDYTECGPTNWRSGFAVLTFHNGVLLWPEVVSVLSPGSVQFRGEVIPV